MFQIGERFTSNSKKSGRDKFQAEMTSRATRFAAVRFNEQRQSEHESLWIADLKDEEMKASSVAGAKALAEGRKSQKNGGTKELRRSLFSGIIVFLYRILNCRRRWRVASVLLDVILRLEGGGMQSSTARQIMSTFHGVEIGAYSYGNCFDPKIMPSGILIGRYVSIGPGVRMFVQNHPIDKLTTHPFLYGCLGFPETVELPPGRLEIGSDVWIGCNAVITPGCKKIGNGAIVGAGAIVTKDVPAFSIVAGNPARQIRERFAKNVVERLQASKWWENSVADLVPLMPSLKLELQDTSTDGVQIVESDRVALVESQSK